ncbi:heavy metal translocating P-type ATPase [Corynebacterium auriscanis]|uniref:heavy metal translocating P-type ATPase n=1 Tax=Corynebacterium auriscanis TaxID=99807 RepID=UPI003CF2499B
MAVNSPNDVLGQTSFAFKLDDVESAIHATQLERELNRMDNVEAVVIYSTGTAWVSAGPDVDVETIISTINTCGIQAQQTERSLRRRSTHAAVAHTRRHIRRNVHAAQRAWLAEHRKRNDAHEASHERSGLDSTEGLHTARDLITRARLAIAVLFGLPVVILQLFPGLQFDYWQWVCLGLAAPVMSWCAWPFHRAVVGGLRRRMSALDGASSLAILIAFVYSALMVLFTDVGDPSWRSRQILLAGSWSDPNINGSLFLDVSCGVTILLLFGRLLSRRAHLRSKTILSVLSLPAIEELTVVRKNRQGKTCRKQISSTEIRVGDDMIMPGGSVFPSDGEVISGKSVVDLGPVGGLHRTVEVSVGDRVFAGGRNLGNELKIRALTTGSQTRLAAMQRWVVSAVRDENRIAHLTNRTASLLVPWTVGIAVINFFIWWGFVGSWDAAMATSLSALACVAPVALALSAPLALRLGLWRSATQGTLLRDTSTLHRLADVDSIIFNRVGTLTTGPMRVKSVTAADGENPELLLRVAASLSMESDHGLSKAIVRADREARDASSGDGTVPQWLDTGDVKVTDDGTFIGTVVIPMDGDSRHIEARLWRPRDVGQVHNPKLAHALVDGGSPVVISWRGRDRGVINVIDDFKPDAAEAIDELEGMDLETFMLSRDPYPVARRVADSMRISTVLAGIAPNRKEATVRGVHAQGARVAMVGDNDIRGALRVADVGILMGAADQIDKAVGVADVVMLRDDVMAIPETVNFARHVRRTVDWNVWLSWGYNAVAVLLALLGFLNPMLATVLMLLSSTLIEFRSARILHRNFSRSSLSQTHRWEGWIARLQLAREHRRREELRATAIDMAREDALEEARER